MLIVTTCGNNFIIHLPTRLTTEHKDYHLVFGASFRVGVHALPSQHATLQGDIVTRSSCCYVDPYNQGAAGTPTTQRARGT